MPICIVSIVDFVQVFVWWECTPLVVQNHQPWCECNVTRRLCDVFLLILNSYLVTRLFAIIEPHLGLLENIVIMEWELVSFMIFYHF